MHALPDCLDLEPGQAELDGVPGDTHPLVRIEVLARRDRAVDAALALLQLCDDAQLVEVFSAQLGVVAQLEKDDSGTYRSVRPGENLYPNEGVRIAGNTVQLGLARFEIEAVWKRMQDLLARVESGEIPLF